jgi:hypothetical protein
MMNLARHAKGSSVSSQKGVVQISQGASGSAEASFGFRGFSFSATVGIASTPVNLVSFASNYLGRSAANLITDVGEVVQGGKEAFDSNGELNQTFRELQDLI